MIKILTICKVIPAKHRWIFVTVAVSSYAFSILISTTDLFARSSCGFLALVRLELELIEYISLLMLSIHAVFLACKCPHCFTQMILFRT